MPAVGDNMMVKPPRKSSAPRKSKLEGEDPYIPFKARPLPASTTERMNLCKAQDTLLYRLEPNVKPVMHSDHNHLRMNPMSRYQH